VRCPNKPFSRKEYTKLKSNQITPNGMILEILFFAWGVSIYKKMRKNNSDQFPKNNKIPIAITALYERKTG